jgi:pyruvate/2-oxoglutarate dehydrogenase complex dihydrolipoamide dehydrogenase (E3) component
MIGEQSIELINISFLLIQMNGTLQPFIDVCFNFPSLA